MTESKFEDFCLAAFGEAFPGEFENEEQRHTRQLREFLILTNRRPKPRGPVFEDAEIE